MVEPAGAAALAAVLSGAIPLRDGDRVCVILSGGNVAVDRLGDLLAAAGPLPAAALMDAIRAPDRPRVGAAATRSRRPATGRPAAAARRRRAPPAAAFDGAFIGPMLPPPPPPPPGGPVRGAPPWHRPSPRRSSRSRWAPAKLVAMALDLLTRTDAGLRGPPRSTSAS